MSWFEILKLSQVEEKELARFLVIMVLGASGINADIIMRE